MLNQNNEKYFVKIIGYKIEYVIDGFTTTAKANLISLDNIGRKVSLPVAFIAEYLVLLKEIIQCTITAEVYFGITENQVCISLHLGAGQFCKSFTTHPVFVE